MKQLGLAAGAALVVLAAGCSDQASVFDHGVCTQTGCRRVSVEEAERVGNTTLAHWRRELARGVRERPGLHFANLPIPELRRRLDAAAKEADFDVASFKVLRPRQAAPEIVVRTRHYEDLARSIPTVLDRIDPKRPNSDDRKGWRFEGFYLRAEDEHGVPFFVVYGYRRELEGGGGQWARSENVFPFGHG